MTVTPSLIRTYAVALAVTTTFALPARIAAQ